MYALGQQNSIHHVGRQDSASGISHLVLAGKRKPAHVAPLPGLIQVQRRKEKELKRVVICQTVRLKAGQQLVADTSRIKAED